MILVQLAVIHIPTIFTDKSCHQHHSLPGAYFDMWNWGPGVHFWCTFSKVFKVQAPSC